MSSSEKIFIEVFHKKLEPILFKHGFLRYELQKGWIQPTFIYMQNLNSIWFSCSWDWRDFYMEAEIGKLYSIKDVMPRVEVIGLSLTNDQKNKGINEYINIHLEAIGEKLSNLLCDDMENLKIKIKNAEDNKIEKLGSIVIKKITDERELPFKDNLKSIIK